MTMLTRLALLACTLACIGLSLAACGGNPDPNPSKPYVMPDGRIIQPPPGGWPSYNRGGENGGSGGRN